MCRLESAAGPSPTRELIVGARHRLKASTCVIRLSPSHAKRATPFSSPARADRMNPAACNGIVDLGPAYASLL
ncbi:hypothetical protein VFPFJ_07056 [Purpureocillium lilacinum]|uniref:Uncharacterized protein n=1 Tax=Purpureocillium lilacinum TaxID=33203 RepID=A0A179HGA0_PURLI|nr:hypothetical protein VFPFJ_07056 [Purpureocillium lilacinum]OAQ88591.1 hypothetical protein VFPFJ_07056 [Purpureocillium lilacinum]